MISSQCSCPQGVSPEGASVAESVESISCPPPTVAGLPVATESLPVDLKQAIKSCRCPENLRFFVSMIADYALTFHLNFHDIILFYHESLTRCHALNSFSILEDLMDLMKAQNVKLGITEMNLGVWHTFFAVYFSRRDVNFGREWIQYFAEMHGEGSNVNPDIDTFRVILSGLLDCERWNYFEILEIDFINLMESHDLIPTLEIYEKLMQIHGKMGRSVPGDDVVELHRVYQKATDLLMEAMAFNNIHDAVQWDYQEIIRGYKSCLDGATLEDYNVILEYIATIQIKAIREMLGRIVFLQIMPSNHVVPDRSTYFWMMRIYAPFSMNSAKTLWQKYVAQGLANQNDGMTFRILLEYWLYARNRRDIPMEIRWTLEQRGFAMFSSWTSMKSALEFAQSLDDRRIEDTPDILRGVASIGTGTMTKEVQMSFLETIFGDPTARDWIFDDESMSRNYTFNPRNAGWCDEKIVRFELYKIMLNKQFGRRFAEVDKKGLEFFNRLLRTLQSFSSDSSHGQVADFIFVEAMPFYGIEPDVETCKLMKRTYDHQDDDLWKCNMDRLWEKCIHLLPKRTALTANIHIMFLMDLFQKIKQIDTTLFAAPVPLGKSEMFNAMVQISKMADGSDTVRDIILYSLSRIYGPTMDDLFEYVLYLNQVIRFMYTIHCESDEQWLQMMEREAETQRKLATFHPLRYFDIHRGYSIAELGLKLSLMSLGVGRIAIGECIAIIWNSGIFTDLGQGRIRLNFNDFDGSTDRLLMWWLVKTQSNEWQGHLEICGALETLDFVRGITLKDVIRDCSALSTNQSLVIDLKKLARHRQGCNMLGKDGTCTFVISKDEYRRFRL